MTIRNWIEGETFREKKREKERKRKVSNSQKLVNELHSEKGVSDLESFPIFSVNKLIV